MRRFAIVYLYLNCIDYEWIINFNYIGRILLYTSTVFSSFVNYSTYVLHVQKQKILGSKKNTSLLLVDLWTQFLYRDVLVYTNFTVLFFIWCRLKKLPVPKRILKNPCITKIGTLASLSSFPWDGFWSIWELFRAKRDIWQRHRTPSPKNSI